MSTATLHTLPPLQPSLDLARPRTAEARALVLETLRPVTPQALLAGRAAPARTFSEAQVEQARRDAYQQGFAEGKRLIEEQLSQIVKAMVEAVRSGLAEQAAARQSLQQDALGLSLAIARQVVMGELRSAPERITEILSALLDEAEGRKALTVLMHPDDAARVMQSPLGKQIEQSEVEVKPSEEITPGGCVLDTAFGRLDARLETRMAELAESLLGRSDLTASQEEAARPPAPDVPTDALARQGDLR